MEKSTKHPSFGVVEVSRLQGHATLVGSEVTHQHFFLIKIKEAECVENYGERTFYSRNNSLVEIFLTPNQFVDMITNVGMACGTPCTIRWANGERREDPPKINSRIDCAANAGKEVIEKNDAKNKELVNQIMTEVSGLSEKKKQAISKLLENITSNVRNNNSFYMERITEATEKSISIAKTEVESFVASTVRALGLKSLKTLGLAAEEEKDECHTPPETFETVGGQSDE
jgi:hypothetical protein